jgi:uncharacterized protein YdeI (YjbR/CyaY-like superfamily)
MPDFHTDPRVDSVIAGYGPWRDAFARLRAIILDCGLSEDLKWGQPCYSRQGRNIVLMHGFKDYCALLFFKGALMKDPNGILVQQTQNVQSARQVRFTDTGEIAQLDPVLRAYIQEAIEIGDAGLEVRRKTTAEFTTPPEFQARLDQEPGLKAAFEALTPGRQRGYLLHISSAKQAKTREARIEKCAPRILDGKGLDD